VRTTVSLEDRVHASDQAVRSLVEQVITEATLDRNAAVSAARDEACAEAEQAAEERLADVEALTVMKASENVRQKVVA
jgi:hypothetical protein